MSTTKWMSKITKDFGVVASNMKKKEPLVVPSLSPSLNWATARGGYVPGKINIMFGPESAGKSLLAMMGIIQQQKMDKDALSIWFDAEFAFNIDLFIKLGGDTSRLAIRKSNDPLKIFDYIGGELLEMLQEGAPIKAIAIDSIKSIRYPKDHKKQTTDQTMGGSGAPYLTSALKLVIPVVAEFELLTFFIQQVSMQLDPMKAMRNPYILPDGLALKHAGDLMLEITKVETKAGIMESGETITGSAQQVGHKIRVKVKKNRMGIPARVAQFSLDYEKGIVNIGEEVFELAKSLGAIYHPVSHETGKANPQMWQYGSYPPVRGEANIKKMVEDDKRLQDEIIATCNSYKDSRVELNADGTIKDESGIVDLNLDIADL